MCRCRERGAALNSAGTCKSHVPTICIFFALRNGIEPHLNKGARGTQSRRSRPVTLRRHEFFHARATEPHNAAVVLLRFCVRDRSHAWECISRASRFARRLSRPDGRRATRFSRFRPSNRVFHMHPPGNIVRTNTYTRARGRRENSLVEGGIDRCALAGSPGNSVQK